MKRNFSCSREKYQHTHYRYTYKHTYTYSNLLEEGCGILLEKGCREGSLQLADSNQSDQKMINFTGVACFIVVCIRANGINVYESV